MILNHIGWHDINNDRHYIHNIRILYCIVLFVSILFSTFIIEYLPWIANIPPEFQIKPTWLLFMIVINCWVFEYKLYNYILASTYIGSCDVQYWVAYVGSVDDCYPIRSEFDARKWWSTVVWCGSVIQYDIVLLLLINSSCRWCLMMITMDYLLLSWQIFCFWSVLRGLCFRKSDGRREVGGMQDALKSWTLKYLNIWRHTDRLSNPKVIYDVIQTGSGQ